MPVVESSVVVPVPPEVAFWVSQTHGAPRYRWDPFVREQHLVGADEPDRGGVALLVLAPAHAARAAHTPRSA